MARFDVHRFPGLPLVVDVQADILGHLTSRVVIPLVEAAAVQREAMPRLKPIVDVHGVQYRLITTDMASVPASTLGERVTNVGDQRETIIDAVDFLMQGF